MVLDGLYYVSMRNGERYYYEKAVYNDDVRGWLLLQGAHFGELKFRNGMAVKIEDIISSGAIE